MSTPDWTTNVIAYTHWAAYIITYTHWAMFVITYTHRCVIGFCMLFMSLFQQYLTIFSWFLNSDNKT